MGIMLNRRDQAEVSGENDIIALVPEYLNVV
jgi:hypothetical protein